MDRLWTPWRMPFIEQATQRSEPSREHGAPPAAPSCFLCASPAAESTHDRAHLLLHRGARAFVIMNLYPYNSGHLLVAPYRHTGDLPALPADDAGELFALTRRAVGILGAVYRPEGFNVGMNLGGVAGAGVPDHLHVHVVPRWSGDTNFMPVVGDTKVLPETLEQTYDRLLPHFAAAGGEARP